jgi:hypothetical protein
MDTEGLYTTRPATPAEGWGPELRNIELPGTRGADGLPLVVTIRRLPVVEAQLLDADPGTGPEAVAARLEQNRRMAELAVVAPRFNFEHNGDGAGPRWDDLGMAAQMAIAWGVADFTVEGVEEVTAVAQAFRRRNAGGASAGGASGGPGSAGADGAPAA